MELGCVVGESQGEVRLRVCKSEVRARKVRVGVRVRLRVTTRCVGSVWQ